MIIRRGDCGQGSIELFNSKYRKTSLEHAAAAELIPINGISSAVTGAPSGRRAQGWCGREIDPRDLDDGLPRGFLAGAIVQVWVELRLNWACKLPFRRGEEFPRDVGSERRRLEVPTGRGLRRLIHAGNEVHDWDKQILQRRASVSHRLGVGRRTGRDSVHGHAGG